MSLVLFAKSALWSGFRCTNFRVASSQVVQSPSCFTRSLRVISMAKSSENDKSAAGVEAKEEDAGMSNASSEKKTKRASKSPSAVPSEPNKKKARKEPALPKLPVGTKYNAAEMRASKLDGECRCVVSWNVAGLRALQKKDNEAISRLVELEQVDVLCLQEHKLQEKGVDDAVELLGLEGWSSHFSCSRDKLGYSGVATLCRTATLGQPLSVHFGINDETHDQEGRVITIELPDMWVVNVYVPNSGDGLKRLSYRTEKWDRDLAAYLLKLQDSKPVVVAGDFNCAREPIDIHNAHGNLKSAGFTPEERASFEKVYTANGFVDTFRVQHPEVYGYTYFSYRANMRAKEKGWRLDYVLVSPTLADRCHDSFILQDFLGSDHCPIGLVIKNA